MTKQQTSLKWLALLAPAAILLVEQWGTATKFDLNETFSVGTLAAWGIGIDRAMRLPKVREVVRTVLEHYEEKAQERQQYREDPTT